MRTNTTKKRTINKILDSAGRAVEKMTVTLHSIRDNPLISVIVPVYNVESYVSHCLHSITNQSYSNIEIVVVDDGSTDSSFSKCDYFAQKDRRVRVFRKPNGGLSDARNYGLDRAGGEYAVFIDGDDVVAPTFIETLYAQLTKSGAEISSVAMLPISNQVDYLDRQANSASVFEAIVLDDEEILADTLLSNHSTVSACAKLASISFWKKRRFPVGKVYEDLATIPFLLASAHKMAASLQPLYGFVFRRGSITRGKQIRPEQYVNYYKVVVSLDSLRGSSSSVNEALYIKRLNEFARIKRLHKSLSSRTDETEIIFDSIQRELKNGVRSIIRNNRVPNSMKISILLSTYASSFYSLAFELYQLIKIDRIITH